MQPTVPPIGIVAAKWRRRVEGAQDDYKLGVSGKGALFAANAAAASGAYKAAISASDIEQRFKTNVAAAAAKYTARATTLGPGRFAEAAPASEQEFNRGMQPVLAAIASADLPARGPRGSAQNYGRVKPIGDALSKLRTGR